MQTSGTESFSGAESSPAQTGTWAVDATAAGTAASEGASGSVTPAGEFADLEALLDGDPRKDAFLTRLNGQSSQLREARQQLEQYSSLYPYLPLVQELAQHQVTPEQLQAMLFQEWSPAAAEQAAVPEDPAAALDAWLQDRGIDPFTLDDNQYRIAQLQFEHDQRWQQLQQVQEQAQLRAVEADLSAQYQAVTQRYPAFQDPELARALYAQAGYELENGGTLMRVAERFHTALERREREVLARYSADKARDGSAPVISGGQAPAPHGLTDITQMSDEQRRQHIASRLLTAGRAAAQT